MSDESPEESISRRGFYRALFRWLPARASDPAAADRPPEKPASRRGFFRGALAGLLEPAVELLQDRLEVAGLGDLDTPEPYAPARLRPPGAVPGDAFEQLCTRCGDCAKACPVGAILMDPLPRIDPSVMGCRLCQDLPCVAACKTSALEPLSPEEVSLGLAVWDPSQCLLPGGEECSLCLKACPVDGALRLEAGYLEVVGEKCTGCGCCQCVCPTDPKAITVEAF